MVFAEKLPQDTELNAACLYFLAPTCLQKFVALTDGATLPLKKHFIPFIVEQAPDATAGFVFVTFQIESYGGPNVALRQSAVDKIHSMSDDVFSVHVFTGEFGYVCFGSKAAAAHFSPGSAIQFG